MVYPSVTPRGTHGRGEGASGEPCQPPHVVPDGPPTPKMLGLSPSYLLLRGFHTARAQPWAHLGATARHTTGPPRARTGGEGIGATLGGAAGRLGCSDCTDHGATTGARQ